MNSDSVIVSRHPAAVKFVAYELFSWALDTLSFCTSTSVVEVYRDFEKGGDGSTYATIPVLSSATADDVRGKRVYGNIPLHLAALAAEVVAIEFDGEAPRGVEYTLDEMRRAGARLVAYKVQRLN